MENTNLFKHAPKELVTDAFLAWLFYYLDSEEKFQKKKQRFFNFLFLKANDRDKSISEIKVNLQSKIKNGRIDLLLEFNLENKKQKILFENKTWTSTNQSQLQKYKEGLPNLYKYIYLKLAYVNYHEKQLIKAFDYNCITSEKLSNALKPIVDIHPFITQYLDYINHTFVNHINNFSVALFKKNDFEILGNGQFQEFLMDKLYETLANDLNYIHFKTGSSFGRPWTELYIAQKENIYGSHKEFLFWRIHIRKDNFYIRLSQYANIKNENNSDFNRKKKERLKLLREIASNIISKYNLIPGKLSNSGVNDSEIIIFFLKKNELNTLMKALHSFSLEMIDEYNKRL